MGTLPSEGTVPQEILMLRMVNDEGSIQHFGMLRDGCGFRSVSGYGWHPCQYSDDEALLAEVVAAEIDGYEVDYGPVSFPVTDVVASSISNGRFAVTSIALLEGFQAAGAPNI